MSKSWQKISVVAASAVAFIATFLPWIGAGSITANALDADGGFLYLLGALAALGVGIADMVVSKSTTRKAAGITGICGGAVMLLFVIILMGNPAMKLLGAFGAGLNFGGILGIIASIAVIVFSILSLRNKKDDKDGKKSSAAPTTPASN